MTSAASCADQHPGTASRPPQPLPRPAHRPPRPVLWHHSLHQSCGLTSRLSWVLLPYHYLHNLSFPVPSLLTPSSPHSSTRLLLLSALSGFFPTAIFLSLSLSPVHHLLSLSLPSSSLLYLSISQSLSLSTVPLMRCCLPLNEDVFPAAGGHSTRVFSMCSPNVLHNEHRADLAPAMAAPPPACVYPQVRHAHTQAARPLEQHPWGKPPGPPVEPGPSGYTQRKI